MPQEIYSRIKSHSDTDGDLLPEMGNGTDTHQLTVPSGKKYSGYTITTKAGTFLSGYSVKSSPNIGSEGDQEIKVDWWYAPFGKVVYELKANVQNIEEEQETVHIWYGEDGWEDAAKNAIDQKLDFKILFKEPDAVKFLRSIGHTSSQLTGAETVVITVAVAAVVIVIFSALAAIFFYGISQGYDMGAKGRVETDVVDAELGIDAKAPRTN